MRVAVNLASRPYVELGPVYNRLRTWVAILVVVGVALYFLYRAERTQAESTLAQVHEVRSNIQQLEHQRQTYQTLMQQPKDAAVLRQSDFLNDAFRRKSFSWTASMTDLETVLPSGVQVLSIDPIVAPDGHVTIRLRVTGVRERALDLVRNLEKSRYFADPRLASESLATSTGTVQNGNDVNFDILADYRPLPLPTTANVQEQKPAVKSGKPRHAARSPKPAGAQTTQPAQPTPQGQPQRGPQ